MAVQRQIALLRGINVGRAKRIAMADLRALVSALGYRDVRTLLNSGNVVFDSDGVPANESARRIEQAVLAQLGVGARVCVLSAAELALVVAQNTLLPVAEHARLLAFILSKPDDRALVLPLLERDWQPEALALGQHAVYLWCADGILASRAAVPLGKLLGDATTARNWATVLKLNALATA